MMELLPGIKDPADLRKLKPEQLPKVCDELRETIIATISKSGGHLGSSLGATEIITALHYVFQTPRDKVVFDTGHQSYSHKILTGRRDKFSSIRRLGGISGFPKRCE
jgi:1-deoxy-D-xylulose-5-phosphate synthase